MKTENSKMPDFTAKATELSRGQAARLFKRVHDEGENLLVIRNSAPYVVVISHEKYVNLLNKANGGDTIASK